MICDELNEELFGATGVWAAVVNVEGQGDFFILTREGDEERLPGYTEAKESGVRTVDGQAVTDNSDVFIKTA